MTEGRTEYTTEQLLALVAGLGLSDPLFLRGAPISDWPDKVRSEVEMLGVRALISRDLIRREGGRLRIPLALQQLIAPLCEPTIVTTIGWSSAQRSLLARCYTAKDVTTVHQPSFAGNHRLRSLPSARLLDALVRLSQLRDIDRVGEEPAKIEEQAVAALVERLTAAVDQGQAFDPTDLDIAGSTIENLSGFGPEMSLSSITVVRRESESVAKGVVVSWLADPDAGQWLVDRVDGAIVIKPASGQEILHEVAAGFGSAAVDLTEVDWGGAETEADA